MNLPLLKSAAEQAKTSSVELEVWQMEISPDDVLRLVAGMEALKHASLELFAVVEWACTEKIALRPQEISSINSVRRICTKALEGIE